MSSFRGVRGGALAGNALAHFEGHITLLFAPNLIRRIADALQTDRQTDGIAVCSYYSALHWKQCGGAVKMYVIMTQIAYTNYS